jgi:hypothetical protein
VPIGIPQRLRENPLIGKNPFVWIITSRMDRLAERRNRQQQGCQQDSEDSAEQQKGPLLGTALLTGVAEL